MKEFEQINDYIIDNEVYTKLEFHNKSTYQVGHIIEVYYIFFRKEISLKEIRKKKIKKILGS